LSSERKYGAAIRQTIAGLKRMSVTECNLRGRLRSLRVWGSWG
jgi:hypothetical protein